MADSGFQLQSGVCQPIIVAILILKIGPGVGLRSLSGGFA